MVDLTPGGPQAEAGGKANRNAEDYQGDATRCLVIHPHLKARSSGAHSSPFQRGSARAPEARLEEICGLAEAIHLDITAREIVPLSHVRPNAFFGKGTLERLDAILKAHDIGLVIVDAHLSPVQQRNMELAWKAKVLDRTGIILEIFGERARTREGRLQVELAHLTYQRSRLVRSWTHLERQRGGGRVYGGARRTPDRIGPPPD